MRHRDHGLVRRIGTLALAATIVNIVIGTAVFTLPAAVAQEAGAAAPVAYIICAFIMAGVVICFAEAGSRVPTSGGAYGTVEAALGPAAGYVTGALLVISSAFASGGMAAALADMAGALVPALSGTLPRLGVILAIYAAIAGTNFAHVHTTARVITAATAIKLVPLLLFVGLGLVFWNHAPPPGPPAEPVTAVGFGRACILTLFAFEGMETALMASGEVRDPARTVPRACFISMLFILVLYLGVQLSAQHLLGSTLTHAAAPLADAAGQVSRPIRVVMLAAAAISMLVWMTSDTLGNSRMLFAFARDNQLPAWFGQLQPRIHVPVNAVVAYVAFAAALAMTGSFLELIVLSSLATVVIYAMACAAALILHRRHIATHGPPLNFKALPLAAAVGLAGMAAMIYAAQWVEIAGTAATVAASLALYWLMNRLRRGRAGVPAVGLGD